MHRLEPGPNAFGATATGLLRAGAALLVITLGACSWVAGRPGQQGDTEGEAAEAEERVAPVMVTTVGRDTMAAKIAASSTIEAELAVTVHAESTGRVTALPVNEGDAVKAGDLLAKLRRDAESTSVKRASVSVEKARLDRDRVQALFAKGAASKEELDNAEITLRNAELDIKDRRRDLGNTTVRAPFDGIVTERLVDPGAFVTSGQQLLSLTDFSTLVARVYVPERELDRIAVGQAAEIEGKAARGRRGTGTVLRISPVVDAATGTVKVTVSLPESLSGGEDGFLPGMYTEVTMTTELHEDVIVVAKTALVYQEDQVFVFVIEGDRARRVKLELGLQDSERAEVLAGLEGGEQVIVAGQAGLKDGARVELVDAAGRPIEVEDPAPAASASGDGAVARAQDGGA